jgi:hypothetical protein
LVEEPPDPDLLYIFFDGTVVERDPSHQDGWDYDPTTNRITFYGGTCTSLQSGDVADLKVVFGAPTSRCRIARLAVDARAQTRI